MMVHYLTDPAVASHRLLGADWSVTGLLGQVARSTDPPLHALIDGGALVTGMTNLEVARWEGVGNNNRDSNFWTSGNQVAGGLVWYLRRKFNSKARVYVDLMRGG